MPDHSVHKAGDLAREERLLLERWLGRALANDETISINAYPPHLEPGGDQREALWREIMTQAQEIGARVQDASGEEIEALVDGIRRRSRQARVRFTFDSNILVRALASPRGPAFRLLEIVRGPILSSCRGLFSTS